MIKHMTIPLIIIRILPIYRVVTLTNILILIPMRVPQAAMAPAQSLPSQESSRKQEDCESLSHEKPAASRAPVSWSLIAPRRYALRCALTQPPRPLRDAWDCH